MRTAAETLRCEGRARQIFFQIICGLLLIDASGQHRPVRRGFDDPPELRQTLFFCRGALRKRPHVYKAIFSRGAASGESPKRFDPLTPRTDSNLVRGYKSAESRLKGRVSSVTKAAMGGVMCGARRPANASTSGRWAFLLVDSALRAPPLLLSPPRLRALAASHRILGRGAISLRCVPAGRNRAGFR